VQWLLTRSKKTPLIIAIEEGHVDVVRLLLEHVGKIDVLSSMSAGGQQSPIAVAVQAMRPEVLTELLSSKGDPNAKVMQAGHSGSFGGAGLFGGGRSFQSSRFGAKGAPFGAFGQATCMFGTPVGASAVGTEGSTVLDWAQSKLDESSAQLRRLRKSEGKEEYEMMQQCASVVEYFDFLLSKTPSGFTRFVITELRARSEKTPSQQLGPQFQSQAAGAAALEEAEQVVEKVGAIVQTLKEFGAKCSSEIEQEEQSSQSGPKAVKKQARKVKSWMRGMMSQQSGSSESAAFLVGVAGPPAQQSPVGGGPFGQACGFGQPCAVGTAGPSLNYTERFQALATPKKPGAASLDSEIAEARAQAEYLALFDAVVADDCDTVLRLCEPRAADASESAGQAADAAVCEASYRTLIVAVKSTLLDLTLLDLAVIRDSAAMVRCLLQMAARQHTVEEDEDSMAAMLAATEQVSIVDSQLVGLGAQEQTFANFAQANQTDLQQLQESHTFKRKGHKMLERLERYKAERAEGEVADRELISVCSVETLVQSSHVMELAVSRRCYGALGAFLTELDELDIFVDPKGQQVHDSFGQKGKQVPATPTPFKSALLCAKKAYAVKQSLGGVHAMTPFEAALSLNYVKMAELLLAKGAQDCFRGREGAELPHVYAGLNVAGQKREDWALPQRLVYSRTAARRERLRGLHIAATAGAEASIDFLLDGGLDSFAVVGDMDEQGALLEEEEVAFGSLFSLEDRDKDSGYTALHFAVQNDQTSTLQRLLATGQRHLGTEKLLELLNSHGEGKRTWELPLHCAVRLGKHDCAVVLLEHKAAVTAEDAKGQTALHYAVHLAEHSEETKQTKSRLLAAVLNTAKVDGSVLQLLSMARCGGTALHSAAENQSQLTLEAILEQLMAVDVEKRRPVLEASHSHRTHSRRMALHIAALHSGAGRAKGVRALLDAAADPCTLDGSGATPLHLAAKTGAPADVIEMLLPPRSEGAPPLGAEDAEGRTPLEWYMVHRAAKLSTGRVDDRGQAAETIALLSRAEAGGRKIVKSELVRECTAFATSSAATVSKPAASTAFGSTPFGAEDEDDDYQAEEDDE